LAEGLAHLDVFSSLAEAAIRYNYKCPRLTDSDEIVIKAGRHPVLSVL